MPDSLLTEFEYIIRIVKTLRAPDGCPWDAAQTHASLIPYLLEEAYEVIESIEENDLNKLREELGDLLLHIVFQADIAESENQFTLTDSIRSINQKLIRRHPHVFGNVAVQSIAEIKKNWEEIKLREGRHSLMDGLPQKLPSLLQAQRVQLRAAEIGFDWSQMEDVWRKVEEETGELRQAIDAADPEQIRAEFGDLLFALVNLSRFLNINAEDALRAAVKKFIRRFRALEEVFAARGQTLRNATLAEMDTVWEAVKCAEIANGE